jgi:hypothetical protein
MSELIQTYNDGLDDVSQAAKRIAVRLYKQKRRAKKAVGGNWLTKTQEIKVSLSVVAEIRREITQLKRASKNRVIQNEPN